VAVGLPPGQIEIPVDASGGQALAA